MGEFPNRSTQFKPGEAANPEGRNQYTYRREALKHLDEWCKEHGRDFVRELCELAKKGKPWAAKLILDRVIPVIQKHEHDFSNLNPAKIETHPERLDQVTEILNEAETLH